MSTRKQSFLPTQGVEVQYEGSKSFWKTRTNLELIIASHPRCNCLEVIGFDSTKGLESRLYVNAALLTTKLDQNEIKLRVEEKKEGSIRQKKAFILADIQKEIVINSMNQFIISRLQIDDQNKLVLSPMSGDVLNETTNQLDIVMEASPNLIPLSTAFQKKVSVSDIRSAMNQLEVESMELKRATRLAELATSSVDGFKAMLAEKMKLESEMKKKFTVARLRWIKAINRVLIQNYVEKVRVRLGMVSPVPSTPQGKARPKIMRHSLDNSFLDNKSPSSLPSINKPSPISLHGNPHHLGTMGSLPLLSPMNNSPQHHEHSSSEKRKKRTLRTGDGKLLTRKSYEALPSPEAKSILACPSNDSVPSLRDSYASMSTRHVPECSVPIVADIREHSIRALRLAKI